MVEQFDVIVVGGGAMGTSTARHLAMRGRRTLLVERFAFGHANGSSGGPTRIWRVAYPDPRYVRMARQSLDAWRELEEQAGTSLLRVTGGVDLGAASGVAAEALRTAGEPVERLAVDEARERWPALQLPPGTEIYFQADGGVVRAAETVRAQALVAASLGATIREHVRVVSLTRRVDGVEVVTNDDDVAWAPVAVVTAGAWAGSLLRGAGVEVPLVPTLEQTTYFQLAQPTPLPTVIDRGTDPAHPPYVVPDPWTVGSVKAGLHHSGPPTDADDRRFEPDPVRVEATRAYVRERFAGVRDTDSTETCLYTMTPDEDFIVDRVGEIVIGSPCSGHGFKFVPLMGSLLADLATEADPSTDLEMFRLSRPALARHGD
jgi:sarcosine oxidase